MKIKEAGGREREGEGGGRRGNPTSALFQVDGILSVVAMQFRGCSFPLLLLSVPPAPSDHSFGPRVIPSPPRLEQRGLLELA